MAIFRSASNVRWVDSGGGPGFASSKSRLTVIAIRPMKSGVLVKSGIISEPVDRLDPIDAVPLDPKQPRAECASRRASCSMQLVAVPADTGAVVTARSLRRDGKVLSKANADLFGAAHDHAVRRAQNRNDPRPDPRECRPPPRSTATRPTSKFPQGDAEDHGTSDRDYRRRRPKCFSSRRHASIRRVRRVNYRSLPAKPKCGTARNVH